MNEETQSTLVVESPVTESPAQEAAPTSTEVGQSQDTTPQPGRTEDKPTSNVEARKPKASEFYGERAAYKRRIEGLEATISKLNERFETFAKPAPTVERKPKPFDQNKFWVEPDKVLDEVLSEREKDLLERYDKKLEERLPQLLSEREKGQEFTRKTQEGFELIFPKSGADDARTAEERALADPERLAKVNSIMKQFKLDALSKEHPKEAAEMTLKLLDADKPAVVKNPNVIKKALVGSTATGTPLGGGKKMPTLADIQAQLTLLDKELDKNPDFRYEDAFVAKNKELRDQLSVLAKELEKTQ